MPGQLRDNSIVSISLGDLKRIAFITAGSVFMKGVPGVELADKFKDTLFDGVNDYIDEQLQYVSKVIGVTIGVRRSFRGESVRHMGERIEKIESQILNDVFKLSDGIYAGETEKEASYSSINSDNLIEKNND